MYGFRLGVLTAEGIVSWAAFRLFSAAAFLLLPLMAMVFRNIQLILRTAKGKTWFSQGSTPFQKDIVRMVREIGIFSLAVPVIGLLLSFLARLVLGAETAELSVNFGGLVTGLVVLSLSQIFAYGMSLQKEVDGLL